MKNYIKNLINVINRINLTQGEKIILSITIGVSMLIIFGYTFGEAKYYLINEGRITKEFYDEMDDMLRYSEFHFNYILGVSSCIISTGISYLFLQKISLINENCQTKDTDKPI